jgi:hypothetical protein
LSRRALQQDDAPGRTLGAFSFPGGPIRLASALAALLAGCAINPVEISEARDSWQGAAYGEVVARWGAPSRSAKLPDGRDSHTWVSQSAGSRGTGGGGIGTGVMFGSADGEPVRCERTLVFRNDRVADQTWRGPPEYCSEFGRRR